MTAMRNVGAGAIVGEGMADRLIMLVNPGAGGSLRSGGAALAEHLLEAASWADTQLRVIETDPCQAAAEACRDKPGVIAVAGGDGTARAVAEAVARTGCGAHVLPLPMGTANLMARRLYGLRTAPQILAEAEHYRPVRLHAGVVGDRYFFIMAAAGFPSKLAEAREDIRLHGKGRRFIAALDRTRAALGSAFKASLKLYADGSPVYYQRASAVLIAPGGLDQTFASDRPQPGPPELECIAARARHIFDAASITVSALTRDWRKHRRVRQRWVKELEVRGRDRLPVMIDGEPEEFSGPAAFRIIPEAASFLAPDA